MRSRLRSAWLAGAADKQFRGPWQKSVPCAEVRLTAVLLHFIQHL